MNLFSTFSVAMNNTSEHSGKLKLAKLLLYTGYTGLLMVPGLILGFYAGDQGIRWLPTMLEIILVLCFVSLLVIVTSQIIRGKVVKSTRKGLRIRRRITFCLVLASVGIVGRLILFWAQQPSPLTGLSVRQFNQAFEIDLERFHQYDSGMQQLLNDIEAHPELFDRQNQLVLSAEQEEYLRNIWTAFYDYSFALDQIRFFYEDWYRFDPSRARRHLHLRSFLLTFAAELSLYEKSTRLIQCVTANENVVKFLNTPIPSHDLEENSFSRFREQLQGTRDSARVIAGEQYLRWLDKGLSGRQEARALGCTGLWNKVETEINLIKVMAPAELTSLTIESDLEIFKRKIKRIWYPSVQHVAEWMGDTRLRRIGAYLITQDLIDQVKDKLQPGDIILTRKNWYLSNVGLPGFWPHAILHIGAPSQLKSYFDDPEVLSAIQQLSGRDLSFDEYLAQRFPLQWLRYLAGLNNTDYVFMEAVSEGVILSNFEMAKADYMAALRPHLDKKAQALAVIEAFSHLDKPYDYNFDFATDHALVCTELVWRSHRPTPDKPGLKFTLSEIAGRTTLPANHIARHFAEEYEQPDAQMDFVFFIDAREKEQSAAISDVNAFLETPQRSKWDIIQK